MGFFDKEFKNLRLFVCTSSIGVCCFPLFFLLFWKISFAPPTQPVRFWFGLRKRFMNWGCVPVCIRVLRGKFSFCSILSKCV